MSDLQIYGFNCSSWGWQCKNIEDTNANEAAKIFVRRRMRRRGVHSSKLKIDITFRDHRKTQGHESAEVDCVVTTKDGSTYKDNFGLAWWPKRIVKTEDKR